jgi:hypothetical protein
MRPHYLTQIDYETQSIYHMPPPGAKALSPAIAPPTGKDGKPDAALLSRLYPRHDDSEDNVLARLALWDLHSPHLRAAYEDVSLRLDASGPANDGTPESGLLLDKSVSFLCIESKIQDVEVVPSTELTELQYEIVDTLRYRRRQLVQVYQGPGARGGRRTYWVDAKELAGNSHCILVAQDPTQFLPHQQRRRWARQTNTISAHAAIQKYSFVLTLSLSSIFVLGPTCRRLLVRSCSSWTPPSPQRSS